MRQLALVEAGNRHGDAIGVLAGALDIVGRIGRLIGLGKAVQHGEDRRSKPTVER